MRGEIESGDGSGARAGWPCGRGRHGRDARATGEGKGTGETAGEMRGEETTTVIRLPGVCQECDTSASCVPLQNETPLRRHTSSDTLRLTASSMRRGLLRLSLGIKCKRLSGDSEPAPPPAERPCGERGPVRDPSAFYPWLNLRSRETLRTREEITFTEQRHSEAALPATQRRNYNDAAERAKRPRSALNPEGLNSLTILQMLFLCTALVFTAQR